MIKLGKESSESLLRGIDVTANILGGTLGPKGRNVFIQKPYQDVITNDGTSIASSIVLIDPFEDMGCRIVRNISAKQDDECGDGTTTVAVLLQAIIHECLKRNENPMEIRDSLLLAGEKAIDLLKKRSFPCQAGDLMAVASISVENEELATMITDLIGKLGDKAIINVDDSQTSKSGIEIIPGYDAPVGFVSPYFINEKATGKSVFSDVYVLVSEKKISTFTDIQKISKEFQDKGISQGVIVCDDIDDSMVGIFVTHNLQGTFKSVVIRARGEILEDIAGATGATSISERNGVTFQNIDLSHLGHVEKVVVDANKSLFLGSSIHGALRAGELEGMAESEENMYRKSKLKERAAKLRGGIGVLRVGANSDYERDYLKLKAEDGIKAVQAAQEEGIVEGGGIALWRVACEMDVSIGGEILAKAMKAPLAKIIENAGKDYNDIVSNLGTDKVWNAKIDEFQTLKGSTIVDPAKVERVALLNAISSASTFITSFCAIVDDPKEKK